MDVASIIGIAVGMGCILVSIVITPGARVGMFVDYPSMFIVGGGTFAAMLMSFPFRDLATLGRVMKAAFFQKLPPESKLIADFRRYADIARRDGILALEKVTGEIRDPFLLSGMQAAIDGMDPEMIQNLMRSEMDYMAARHERGVQILKKIGAYGPAFGMVGTLIGLVIMLANLKDPEAIGPSMAVAIITTFYGAMVAYMFALPLADKLTFRNSEEMFVRELMARGLASIQSGDSPRVVEQKLKVLLPPRLRERLAAGK
ncbi:MAG TPA: MotA/TolQ/ExbB proton channel family protein [Planctomycetota bacterium]